MENKLMVFEGNNVEILDINGEILFNPYHVGRCLDLGDSAIRMAISSMSDKQVIKLTNSDVKDVDFRKLNNAGENFLTEKGIYRLVFKSRKEEALRFQDWVTDEVLPTIRKTGGYVNSDEQFINTYLPFADETTKMLFRGTLEMVKKQNETIQVMQPKAEYFDKILTSESCFTTSQIAKECFMSAKQLNLILANDKIQYKQNGQWLLYATYQSEGYTKTRTKDYLDSEGVQQTKHYTVWTERGREFIIDLVDDL